MFKEFKEFAMRGNVIDLAVGKQILERHLHENDNSIFGTITMPEKDAARSIQHIVCGISYRSKTAALNKDRLFVKYFGRLNGLAVCLEHHRIRQTLANQL